MAAGTSVTASSTPHVSFSGEFTLNPGSIAAAGREEQTVAIPGAKVGDQVTVSPQDALSAGLVISHARVASAGNISFYIANHSAGAVDQASGKWNYRITRGSNQSPYNG